MHVVANIASPFRGKFLISKRPHGSVDTDMVAANFVSNERTITRQKAREEQRWLKYEESDVTECLFGRI